MRSNEKLLTFYLNHATLVNGLVVRFTFIFLYKMLYVKPTAFLATNQKCIILVLYWVSPVEYIGTLTL